MYRSIVMLHSECYEQFSHVGQLDQALILLGLGLCLLFASVPVSSVFIVLYIFTFTVRLLHPSTSPFSELSLVELALSLVD